jgi:hypothetical protein
MHILYVPQNDGCDIEYFIRHSKEIKQGMSTAFAPYITLVEDTYTSLTTT